MDDFLVLVNAWWEPLEFVLPAIREPAAWHVEVNSYDLMPPSGRAAGIRGSGDRIAVGPRSVVVLCDPRVP